METGFQYVVCYVAHSFGNERNLKYRKYVAVYCEECCGIELTPVLRKFCCEQYAMRLESAPIHNYTASSENLRIPRCLSHI
jgi:hypothetical protein